MTSSTPPQQCSCGKSIWWHYVRRTKAGVNAYCNVGPRVAVSRRLPPHRSASLEDSARDVWDRIHTISAADRGVQERPAIRSEIEDLQPDYPVKLVVPAVAAVHGRRVRSFQLRIEPGDTTSVWGEVDAELRRCVLKSGGAL